MSDRSEPVGFYRVWRPGALAVRIGGLAVGALSVGLGISALVAATASPGALLVALLASGAAVAYASWRVLRRARALTVVTVSASGLSLAPEGAAVLGWAWDELSLCRAQDEDGVVLRIQVRRTGETVLVAGTGRGSIDALVRSVRAHGGRVEA